MRRPSKKVASKKNTRLAWGLYLLAAFIVMFVVYFVVGSD
jgi:hypothetical protein